MLTRAHAALLASLALLLTAGPVAAPALADGAGTHRPAVSSSAVALQQDTALNRTDTTFRIAVRPDGDAVWTITRTYTLGTEARRAAFDSVAEEFEDGRGFRTMSTVRAASDRASAVTGRPMAITGVTRRSAVVGSTGRLVLQFTWTGFARKSGARLVVDDVFLSPERTWFPTLGPNQTLVIAPPPGYDLVSASPRGYSVTNGSLRWSGIEPTLFSSSPPAVVYERSGPVTNNSTAAPQAGGVPPLLLLGLAILVVAGLIAYLLATRDVDLPSPASPTGDDGGGDDESPAATAGTAASTTDGGTADAEDDAGIDPELLSDEERIERLLEQNGGRMKQATIVEETDWSNAKVSQLLSSMDEDGRIDKLRIGRENLISFPDEDVTDGEEPESDG
ncbi:MAG: helix-turn-helix transcriptional regulator [Halorientalis sp.]